MSKHSTATTSGRNPVGRLLSVWQQRIRSRRQMRELCRMDDRTLADIGLTRAQVVYEASRPFWQ
jgi:uncharacterized protein YjiS (DUF1127 family)